MAFDQEWCPNMAFLSHFTQAMMLENRLRKLHNEEQRLQK